MTIQIGIDVSFKLSEILDSAIEDNELINESNDLILDIDSKPIFDATRIILQQLIAKIDALNFK